VEILHDKPSVLHRVAIQAAPATRGLCSGGRHPNEWLAARVTTANGNALH
jgi:hypothetical protein